MQWFIHQRNIFVIILELLFSSLESSFYGKHFNRVENRLHFLKIHSDGDHQNCTFSSLSFPIFFFQLFDLLCSLIGKSKHSNETSWFSATALWSHFLLHKVSCLFLGTLNSRYFQSFFTRSLWCLWKYSSPERLNWTPNYIISSLRHHKVGEMGHIQHTSRLYLLFANFLLQWRYLCQLASERELQVKKGAVSLNKKITFSSILKHSKNY